MMSDCKQKMLALFACLPIQAHAELSFDWNGYGTLGISEFQNQTEINGDTSLPYGNFKSYTSEKPDSKLALQGSAKFSDKLSGTIQVISRGIDDYALDLEWAYLRYQLTDELMLRAGRLRRHGYLNSDNYDVGYSYQWLRPPTTAYLTIAPIYDAFETVDLYYQANNQFFDYSAQIYAGATEGSTDFLGIKTHYEEHLATGMTFMLELENTQIHLSHHRSNFSLDYQDAALAGATLKALGLDQLAESYNFQTRDAETNGFGVNSTLGSWGITAEYTFTNFGQALVPELSGWYGTISRSAGDFGLYASYGRQSTKNAANFSAELAAAAQLVAASGAPGAALTAAGLTQLSVDSQRESERLRIKRQSIQLGVRYDFHPSAALKLEYEHLRNRLNNKSGDLYSLSVDFIF